MKELNDHQLLSVAGSGVLTAGFMLGQAISDITTAIVSYSVAVKDEVVLLVIQMKYFLIINLLSNN